MKKLLLLFLLLFMGCDEPKEVKLLAFTSEWCSPCKQMKPVFAELESKGYTVVYVNLPEQRKLASGYKVTAVPTCIVLKNGREASRRTGIVPLNTLIRLMQ